MSDTLSSCEFYPLYSQVHVWGMSGEHPDNVLHGQICSPLIPYYHGDSTAMGYLVKLDEPLTVSQTDSAVSGQMQVVFVHYSSCEYISAGDPPTSPGSPFDE